MCTTLLLYKWSLRYKTLLTLILIIHLISTVFAASSSSSSSSYDETNNTQEQQGYEEVYDSGSPYDMGLSYSYACTTLNNSSGVGTRGTFIQLFTPKQLPWHYTSITLTFLLLSSPSPSPPTVDIPITIQLYRIPEPLTSLAPKSKSTATTQTTHTITITTNNTTGEVTKTIPIDFIARDQRVYIGVTWQSCQASLKLAASSTKDVGRLTLAKTDSSESLPWFSPLSLGVQSFAIRPFGYPYGSFGNETTALWMCPTTNYSDGLYCNCECGVVDPDCLEHQQPNNCISPSNICAQSQCTTVNWQPSSSSSNGTSCDPKNYANDLTCNCGCSSFDPDCLDTFAPVRCPASSSSTTTTMQSPKCDRTTNTCQEQWTCTGQAGGGYNDGNICNCGCSVYDPDCRNSSLPTVGCPSSSSWRCGKNAQCVPTTWTCNDVNYNTADGCHCNCGAYDPDCSLASAVIINCDDFSSSSNVSCSYDSKCIAAYCGNGYPDMILNEQCDGGIGCNTTTCHCMTGFKQSSKSSSTTGSSSCVAVCGDGIVVDPVEQCDGSLYCDRLTCLCSSTDHGFIGNGTCAGCNNGVLEAAYEECELPGVGCGSNCLCKDGYIPYNYSNQSSSGVRRNISCRLMVGSVVEQEDELMTEFIVIASACVGVGLTVVAVVLTCVIVVYSHHSKALILTNTTNTINMMTFVAPPTVAAPRMMMMMPIVVVQSETPVTSEIVPLPSNSTTTTTTASSLVTSSSDSSSTALSSSHQHHFHHAIVGQCVPALPPPLINTNFFFIQQQQQQQQVPPPPGDPL